MRLRFLCETEPRYSHGAHVADLIFKKWSGTLSFS